MSGSSSVRGDQTIYHTDNLCFDGTDRGAPMASDGQLWIGATASNRADNGGHVRLGFITGSGGLTVTNGPGTINIAGTGPSTDLHAPRFIVASSTAGTGANYTTIASAIAAAQGTGINSTVFIQPGTYTENLTLVPGINLCAFVCDASLSTSSNVIIVGKLTLTTAGTVSISGIQLRTNSDFFLAVTGSAASIVNLSNCYLNCLNNTGISYTSSSASSNIRINYCGGNIGTTGITLFAMTSAGRLDVFNSVITNTGSTTTVSTSSAGILSFQQSEFDFPITTSGTNQFGSTNNNFNCNTVNATYTLGGSGTTSCVGDYFSSGTASAISAGNTVRLINCAVDCTNTNAITGAGTVNIGTIDFINSSSTINTTTQVPLVSSNTALKIVTPGAYPYTTTPQDALIKVDTSAARTITPLASPTTGQRHIIKDTVGSAAANNITITPSGKNIDGAASSTININYGSATIVYNGTEWSII